MRKFRSRISSKKGMTLVELVVTVAILGIVASLGVGMVSSAIRNYSVAQKTANEQEGAVMIESFITQAARVYGSVQKKTVKTTPPNDPTVNVEKNVTASYLYFDKSDNNGTLVCLRAEMDGKKQFITETRYPGAQSVKMQLKKQKPSVGDSTSEKCFVFVDYTIEMREGYTLKGMAVLNNAASDSTIAVKDSAMVDEEPEMYIHPGSNVLIEIAK